MPFIPSREKRSSATEGLILTTFSKPLSLPVRCRAIPSEERDCPLIAALTARRSQNKPPLSFLLEINRFFCAAEAEHVNFVSIPSQNADALNHRERDRIVGPNSSIHKCDAVLRIVCGEVCGSCRCRHSYFNGRQAVVHSQALMVRRFVDMDPESHRRTG